MFFEEQIQQLQLENDILREVVDILKVGSLSEISNREKTLIINNLRHKIGIPLKDLTHFLKISKSSYEYQARALERADKYAGIRPVVVDLFEEGNRTWGYRTIWAKLKQQSICISEKVVRQIMREEMLNVVYLHKKRHYNSYEGELSEAPENLVKRNFKAEKPNILWLTDVTEFKIPSGDKCYLSPILDCFDGKIVSWKIGRHPNSALSNGSLLDACKTLKPTEAPICHSDRGAHYRWPSWIDICNEYGLKRSMSKKGCSPDNAACEALFGRIKNEFFYYRDWRNTNIEEFMVLLDRYLHYYNEDRIKKSLGWKSPNQFRQDLGIAV